MDSSAPNNWPVYTNVVGGLGGQLYGLAMSKWIRSYELKRAR